MSNDYAMTKHDSQQTTGVQWRDRFARNPDRTATIKKIVKEHIAQRKGGLAALWVALTRGAIGTSRDPLAERVVTLQSLQQQLSTLAAMEITVSDLRSLLKIGEGEYRVSFRAFADAFDA